MQNDQNDDTNLQDSDLLFQSPALNKFIEDLESINIKGESAGYLAGKLTRVVAEATALKAQVHMGEEGIKEFENIPDPKLKQERLEQIFLHYEGKTVAEFQEELMEKLVADFEKKGEE